MRKTKTLEERFWEKVDVRGPDDCWEWLAGRQPNGYGMFWVNNRKKTATHVALELAGTPVSDGMRALHHCDNPPCVNAEHLYEGTQAQNAADSVARGRHPQVRKTHCPQGHEYAEGNTYRWRGGSRTCQTCSRAHARAWRRKQAKARALSVESR